MIYIWTGKTGSGKTYRMVKLARRYWLKGINIYSNIELLFGDQYKFTPAEKILRFITNIIRKIFRRKLKPLKRGRIEYFEEITDILDVRNGLIVFDDGGVLFNAKNWESLPIEFSNKLQKHRHYNLDLFCSVPNIRTVVTDYRRLIQHWVHCKSIVKIGKKRNIFAVYSADIKDVDSVMIVEDDIKAETMKRRIFFITFFSRKFYDTLTDIAFRRYKIIWIKMKSISQAWIIPKELSLQEGQRIFFSLKSGLSRIK